MTPLLEDVVSGCPNSYHQIVLLNPKFLKRIGTNHKSWCCAKKAAAATNVGSGYLGLYIATLGHPGLVSLGARLKDDSILCLASQLQSSLRSVGVQQLIISSALS